MASLPSTPWTDIEDFRVQVDAPVSQDLMTDIVVDLNYLKSGVDSFVGPTINTYLSNSSLIVPAGVLRALIKLWGPGGGGGAGADASFAGGVGVAGGNALVSSGVSGTIALARGGNPGQGGLVAGAAGAVGTGQAPIIVASPSSLQFGSPTNGTLQAFGLPVSAPSAGNGSGVVAGTAGSPNSGQGGGGGGSAAGGHGIGGQGLSGEYAEYAVTLTPGDTLTITVPSGGVGGTPGGGAGAGGAGAAAMIQIIY